MNPIIAIREFKKHNFLLYYLTARDFKVKYRRSVLGIFWSVLNPLLMMIILSLVFSSIFRADIANFPVYLILGQSLFQFMSEGSSSAMSSILANAPLIKKVYIPKYIFPLEKVIFAFVNFVVSLVAVALVMLVFKVVPSWQIVFLPLLLVYMMLFTLGLGLLLSALAVFFRDIIHLYGVLVTAWTYLTPLFYPISMLPDWLQQALQFNPMLHYVNYFRDILLYHTAPTLLENLICIVFAVVTLVIGLFAFRKSQDKFILHV